MNIVEFGKENKDVICLLHGGGLSWWNFSEAAKMLQREYHVVIPILDGHAGSDADFCGIEENAKRISEYIDEKYNGSVLLIGGVSLGGQILTEMLAQRGDICKFALVESALCYKMKLTNLLVKPMMQLSYGLIKKKWFSKLQFWSLGIKAELYEDYYRDTCKITKENMIAILKANSDYCAPDSLCDVKAKAMIVSGEKEQKLMIRSAHKLNDMMPNSCLKIMEGMRHGEPAMSHPKLYAEMIKNLINQ